MGCGVGCVLGFIGSRGWGGGGFGRGLRGEGVGVWGRGEGGGWGDGWEGLGGGEEGGSARDGGVFGG